MSIFSSDPPASTPVSGQISVIAQARAKSGHEDEVRSLLTHLAAPSRKEPGCLKYDVFEDAYYTGSFYTYEEWETEAHLDTHLTANKEGLGKLKALLREDLRISPLKLLS